MSRYRIFVLFVFFSLILFLATCFIASFFYRSRMQLSLLAQFQVVDIALISFGVYVAMLIIASAVGLFFANRRGRVELSAGLKISLLFSIILLVAYMVIFFTSWLE